MNEIWDPKINERRKDREKKIQDDQSKLMFGHNWKRKKDKINERH